MNKIICLLLLAVSFIFTSCQDELIEKLDHSGAKSGIIYLNPEGNHITTRAGSSEYEEGLIHNSYVMLFRIENPSSETPTLDEISAADIIGRWSVERDALTFVSGMYEFQTHLSEGFLNAFDDRDRFFFAAVSNYGEFNSIMELDENELENLMTFSDLENVRVHMRPNTFTHERGSNFLMSGRSAGFKTLDELRAIIDNPNTNFIRINLKRTDAKIHFHLDTSELEDEYNSKPGISHATVDLIRWRASNLPTSTTLIEGPNSKHFVKDSALYHTKWMNFEGVGNDFNEELTFYVLPRAYMKKEIQDGDSEAGSYISIRSLTDTPEKLGISNDGNFTDLFTDAEKKDINHKIAHFSYELRKAAAQEISNGADVDYPNDKEDPIRNAALRKLRFGLREKQLKALDTSGAFIGEGTLTNGAYSVAPQDAPYLEFEGRMTYRLTDGTMRSADVRYNIHLGYVGIEHIYTPEELYLLGLDTETIGYQIHEEDDYFTRRNTFYDYNAWITGSNDIMAEVDSYQGLTGPDKDNPYIEDAPGAEGNIFYMENYSRVSSANSQYSYTLDLNSLDIERLDFRKFTWAVSTPFGQFTDLNPVGIPADGIVSFPQKSMKDIDHNWIKIAINKPGIDNTAMSRNHRVFLGEREAPLNYYEQVAGSGDDVQYRRTIEDPANPTDGGDRYSYYNNEFNFTTIGATKAFLSDYYAGVDLMLNPRQAIQLMVMLIKDLANVEGGDGAFDQDPLPLDRLFSVTIFIEEYYYDRIPIGINAGRPTFRYPYLIDKFIHAEDRTFALLSDFNYSHDSESSYAQTSLLIEQASIQSIYDPNVFGKRIDDSDWSQNDLNSYVGDDVAFGGNMHTVGFGMDGTRAHYDTDQDGLDNNALVTHPNINRDYAMTQNKAISRKSGLQNSQIIARTPYGSEHTSNSYRWDTFIDMDTYHLQGDYNKSINQFMLSNRDENGNGIVDIHEIKWYLPSIDQYIYTELGKKAIATEALLAIPNMTDGIPNPWGSKSKVFISSTNGHGPGKYVTFWANGGGDNGVQEYNGSGEPVSASGFAKCFSHSFRNIAVPIPDIADPEGQVSYPGDRLYYSVDLSSDHIVNEGLQMHYGAGGKTYSLNRKNITEFIPPVLISDAKPITDGGRVKYAYEYHLKYLDERALRSYYQDRELTVHNHFSSHNAPRRKFQVMSFREFDDNGFNIRGRQPKLQWEYISNSTDNDPTNDPCPEGWRMPNQKELILIATTKPNLWYHQWAGWENFDWWVANNFHEFYGCGTYFYLGSAEDDNRIAELLSQKQNPNSNGYDLTYHRTKRDGMSEYDSSVDYAPGLEYKMFYGILSNNYMDSRARCYILPVRDLE